MSTEQLLAYWFAQDSRLNQGLLDALAPYRQRGISVLLATNQEHRRADYLMHTLGLAGHVDGIVYSAALGHRKPTSDFYRLATERSGVAASEILFLDDSENNIAAARDFGWTTIHWFKHTNAQAALGRHLD